MTHIQLEIFWPDVLVILLFIISAVLLWRAQRSRQWRAAWQKILHSRLGLISLIILTIYLSIAMLDTIHFRTVQYHNGHAQHELDVRSLLDVLLEPIGQQDEKTYSAPFAVHLYVKETMILQDGTLTRAYPRLQYGGAHLKTSELLWQDVLTRSLKSIAKAVVVWLLLCVAIILWQKRMSRQSFSASCYHIFIQKNYFPWRTFLSTLLVVFLLVFWTTDLGAYYHILGTNQIGQDVFYAGLKSIRTDLLIGVLTIGVMLPFAILLGVIAGYFRGWVDDVVQYTYTTLSSVPAVLLIAAAMLSLQIYIANHADYFQTLAMRADVRLLALCVILGITEWTYLCRLLRGETLKLREMDYVQAAITLGVSRSGIMIRHIIPNLLHIVLITAVLDFSGLILAEAVLSYMGIGVDPTMPSWGNMINAARMEMAREPMVWWPLTTAFLFMFTLVIAANLFADAVRDAFDPRSIS